jgi:DHA2 family multidrug resistance protein
MIAYLDDFKLMLGLTLLVLPLLWLIKPTRKKLSAEEEEALHVAMD